MKKLVVLLCLLALSLLANAQTVYTVCYDNVKIHTTADLNGPTSGDLKKNEKVNVLGSSGEWAIINYNGSVAYVLKYFLKKAEESVEDDDTPVAMEVVGLWIDEDEGKSNSKEQSNSKEKTKSENSAASNTNNDGLLSRVRRTFYYGDTAYSHGAIQLFLNRTCTYAATYYYNATRLENIGRGFFTVGCVFYIIGFPLMYTSSFGLGLGFVGTASALITAGIPMWSVGAYRVHNTTNVFNTYCRQQNAYNNQRTPEIGFQIQTSMDGLGFAVTF